MMNWVYLILSGIISGIIGGMGMGGGTLLIPILSICLGFEQKQAQGINLLVFIPNYNRLIILLHLTLLYCSQNSCKRDKHQLQPKS